MEQNEILNIIKQGSQIEQKHLLKHLIEWATNEDPESGHSNWAFLQLLTNKFLGE